MTSVSESYRSKNVIDGSAGGDLALDADVCIIGSGAGGAVTASVLQKAGISVLIVEEGGLHTQRDFVMKESVVYPKLYQDALQRASHDLGVSILQGRTVGGTTVVNWTTSFRTPDHVLEGWNKKHAVGGFDSKTLAPHFQLMEDRLSITKVEESAMNRNNRTFFDGCKSLGWQVDTTRRNVYACLSSGYCGMGCAFNAKRSMLVTMIPDAIEAGARLVHRARIDRLSTLGNEVVSAEGSLLDAGGYQPTGKRITIKAKKFILSAGAINGPGLLLRSGINDEGRVGQRTFLHPTIAIAAEFPEKIEAWSGAPQSAASHHFADRGNEVGIFMEAAPLHPVLAATVLPGLGAQHAANMSRLAHVSAHIALMIDGWHEGTPGGVVKVRPSGAPVLDYPITPMLWEGVRFASARLAEIDFAAGAKRVSTIHEPPYVMRSPSDIPGLEDQRYETGALSLFSAHVMGGNAMGDDPKRSVVSSTDLRHHRLKNLHVIDGSVFLTGLGVNPQLSIYGLAHLMATRLVEADSQHQLQKIDQIKMPAQGDGSQLYAQRCAPCHGDTGHGDGVAAANLQVKPRDLTDPKWQASVDDAQLAKVIVEGGPAVGKDVMMVASPDLRNSPGLSSLIGHLRKLR